MPKHIIEVNNRYKVMHALPNYNIALFSLLWHFKD